MKKTEAKIRKNEREMKSLIPTDTLEKKIRWEELRKENRKLEKLIIKLKKQ